MSVQKPKSNYFTGDFSQLPVINDEKADYRDVQLDNPDTQNATIIPWQDHPELKKEDWLSPTDWRKTNKYAMYRHLDRVNGGLQNGWKWQNKRYETYRLNFKTMESVASRMELPRSLRERAIRIFTGLNLSKIGRTKEWVALAVCAYVLYEVGQRKCHPNARGEKRDKLYREACEVYGCEEKTANRLFYEVQRLDKAGLPNNVRKYGRISTQDEDIPMTLPDKELAWQVDAVTNEVTGWSESSI